MDFRKIEPMLCRMISDVVTVRSHKVFKKHPKLSDVDKVVIVCEITAFYISQCHGLANHEVGSRQFAALVEDTLDGEAVIRQEGIAECDPWLECDMMTVEEVEEYNNSEHVAFETD